MRAAPDPAGPALAEVLALALVEARRYGDDDRIWIRELVQNARDAGARHITFSLAGEDVVIDDDGSGMSRTVAVGQLLRLFSSSKGQDRGAAGCFGVGFWSVLRARPQRIEVDSRAAGDDGVALVIGLERGELSERPSTRATPGTTIRLVAPTPRWTLPALRAALLGHAAMVRGRDDTPPILGLVGPTGVEVLNRPFTLADVPGVVASTAIAGRGFTGHLGLSATPRVELFHHGLRVVEATDLATLVPSLRQRPRRGLGIVLRVDMPGLKVLVDRRTVVEDDAVRALVASCEVAAARLEREVLDDAAPLPLGLRLLDVIGRATARPFVRGVAVAVVATAVCLGGGLAVAGPGAVAGWQLPWRLASAPPPTSPQPLGLARAGLGAPRIDVAGSATHGHQFATRGVLDDLLAIDLRDVPDEIEGLRPRPGRGGIVGPAPTAALPNIATARLAGSGLTVLPRSQILWPMRASLGGTALPIGLTDDELPAVMLPEAGAIVDVAYALTPPPPPRAPAAGATSTSSRALARLAAAGGGDLGLRGVGLIGDAVSQSIRWAADADAARRFDTDPRGVIDKALALGIGDCDVINATYVRALQLAGFRARLARGLVVRNDAIATDLHAWGEVFVDNAWHLVDASPRIAMPVPPPGPTTLAPTATTTTATTTTATTTPTPAMTTTTTPPAPSAAVERSPLPALLATGVGLGVGLVTGWWWWRRRQRRQRRADADDDDVLPLLLAGLRSGAAESLGLLDRAVVPTSRGLISLRRARALAARGRLAVASSLAATTWLHPSVWVLPTGARRVEALGPFLPRLIDVDALRAAIDDDEDDPLLATWQARIDRGLGGVVLRRWRHPGLHEVHLRTRDGQTHQVCVGDDVLALGPTDGWRRLVAEATCLWHLERRP